ncbi:TRAM domain-containing protein [Candidatus Woesearchaeota archaeon]|nr:TRAM domain-containing protein [Candidatus Woesearchaeota archaeon]
MERRSRFRSGPRPQFRSFAPVKVGDELDVTIESVGEKGDGIAKKDGFVLIIPKTKQNDHVRVRVSKVLRKVGFAEVVGEASGAPSEEQPSEEATEEVEEVTEEQEEEPQQDSEDFGEDLEE